MATPTDLRARGLKLVPLCPFVRAYLRRHPDQADLVAGDPAVRGLPQSGDRVASDASSHP
jgi:hypothetical protein